METKQVIAALAALAQENRLAVYRLLVERGPAGESAGTIAAALELPASSLSFHLAQLRHAGLVTQRRQSRQLIYAADITAMNALVGYLTANCCGNPTTAAPVCCPVPAVAEPVATKRARGRS
ncbi:MAG: helix-turn-helix transcriptional regulator [Alphaproteobacteria bacterium]|jgi:DNA-binding transcriptional ArsR family regulator|uniref:ArsR/SmtB family transcription factor n=1 Tax=Rhizorhabdus sp. TaxID=1968843 RepID=UPI001AD3DF7C|nr:metalloregulator ArsR/SmtB family transcription factor [Rhizorhabdus sp.]MBN9529889.1 helix-turn-helix transcriptional regulator [Alphaproteobacteria bacterium]MBP8231567.1 helix-turn-helix transcriptional regulator [Rhizorhabdus sp.]